MNNKKTLVTIINYFSFRHFKNTRISLQFIWDCKSTETKGKSFWKLITDFVHIFRWKKMINIQFIRNSSRTKRFDYQQNDIEQYIEEKNNNNLADTKKKYKERRRFVSFFPTMGITPKLFFFFAAYFVNKSV